MAETKKTDIKPTLKKTTVWAGIVGAVIPVLFMYLGKHFGISKDVVMLAIGGVSTVLGTYIFGEKYKDSKVISAKILADAQSLLNDAVDAEKNKKTNSTVVKN